MKSILLAATAVALPILGIPATAFAAPRLDPAFSDHAVIQRDQPVIVTGDADPGETLTVSLGERRTTARADRAGRFAASFAPITPGASFTITAAGRSGQTTATDLLAGDVYLCSGQSNMELEVERAQDGFNQAQGSADPQLRLMVVDKITAPTPQTRFKQAPAWSVAAPASVMKFSAVCYYMAKGLRAKTGVPIGAIASSWGGSAVSAWMGEPAQRAVGRSNQSRLLALYGRDEAAAARAAALSWEAWWRAGTGDAAGAEPWQPKASLAWQPVPRIGVWEQWGVPALANYNGMVWFRRVVTLTAEQARGATELAIGAVDDMDRTWVNGVAVGAGGNPGTPRRYSLPAGALRAGDNVIVVNASDVYANGGMTGPAEAMALMLTDGTRLPLGTDWQYAVATKTPANAPRVPWDDIAGAGTIYNAMIAPFGRLGLKGVAWYQGESDTETADYDARMRAMIADWRRQFGQPALPFVMVQLAGFGTPAVRPSASGWANVREAQRRVAADTPATALAIAIDLGDPLDIHPGEKHEVGRRVARAMAALAHGATEPVSGPQIASATPSADGGVALRFTGVTGGLHTRSSDRAIGFELCGTGADDCRYTLGSVAADGVTLPNDGRPVTRVRYAWADAPTVNLFDAANRPAGPFEIAVARR